MKNIFFLFFILISFSAQAQKEGPGTWFSYLGTYKVAPRWNIQPNAQARFYNLGADVHQMLLRLGANYHLDQAGKYQVGAGLDYWYNEDYQSNNIDKFSFTEVRLFEQLVMKHGSGRFRFMHRFRLENRFVENKDPSIRFRHLLKTTVALDKTKKIDPGTFYVALLAEPFWNFKGNPFDRLWVQPMLGYKLNKKWTFEIGNQTQVLNGNNTNRIQFWAFHNLKLY